jgi:ABC-2 type transport system permease protein
MNGPVIRNLRILRYALLCAFADLRAVYTWKTWTFAWLSRILCQVAFFALIGRLIGSREVITYLVVGNAVFVIAHVVLLTVSSTAWERMAGTLPLLVASPASILTVFAGRSLQWLLDGVACGTVSLFVLAPVFGAPLPLPAALLAVPVMVVVAGSVYCFALLLGGLVLRVMELRSLAANLGSFFLMLFTGVQVPVTFWPRPWVYLTDLLPLTHGLLAIRSLLAGARPRHVMGQVGWEALVGFGWFLVAALVFRRLAEGGRVDGSIEFGG